MFLCKHAFGDWLCVWASLNLRNSLVSQEAWIREGLHLYSHIGDFLPNLGFNDGPIDVFLQVDKSPVVAHCHTGWDMRVLNEIWGSHFVCSHDIVHVHTDGVADFGRQRRGWRRRGPGLPWRVFRKLENDTFRAQNHNFLLIVLKSVALNVSLLLKHF